MSLTPDKLMKMSRAHSMDELPWLDNDSARELRAAVAAYAPATAGLKMRPYQEAACVSLITRPNVLLADEMGLGKTPESVCAADIMGLENVLIITPKSVALGWGHEIKKWSGRDANIWLTKKKTQTPAGWVVLPWSQITGRLEQLMQTEWDCVIFDESHYAKSPKAQRTQAAFGSWKRVRGAWQRHQGLIDHSKRVWCLTGTPIKNKPIDLYPCLQALKAGDFAKSYDVFGQRYCKQMNKFTPRGFDYTGALRTAELADNLRGTVMVRRMKSEVLKDLPPLQRSIVPLEIKGKELKDLLKRERDMVPMESREAIRAQLGKGSVPDFEECSEMRKEMGVAKIPLVVDYILDQLAVADDNLVICAYHRDVIEGIAMELNKADISCNFIHGGHSAAQRDSIVADANNGKYKVLVVSIPACGTGMNGLQDFAQRGIVAELDWAQSSMWQMEGRLHRFGQKGSVLFHYLLLQDSLDAYMINTVLRKDETEQEILT